MISTKQRAQLRRMANALEPVLQIGKGGIGNTVTQQIADALRARELIKVTVLETAPCEAREAARLLAEQTGADIVQVIGRRLVLFLPNPKEPVIQLVK